MPDSVVGAKQSVISVLVYDVDWVYSDGGLVGAQGPVCDDLFSVVGLVSVLKWICEHYETNSSPQ